MDLQEQLKLVEEMKKRRFFERGEEDIEIFERDTNILKNEKNIRLIPYLCSLMEDDTIYCSPIETVVKAIQFIVLETTEDKKLAILKLFEGTKKMKDKAYEWAMVLHTQFLINPAVLTIYLDAYKLLDNKDDKKFILELLNDIYDEEYFDEPDLQVIINELKKNN